MELDTVTLIATVPAIVALVNFFKKLGVKDKVALALAVVLGIVLSMAQYLWGESGLYVAAAQGLMLGLAAAGLYDLAPGGTSQTVSLTVPHTGPDTVIEPVVHFVEGATTEEVEQIIAESRPRSPYTPTRPTDV